MANFKVISEKDAPKAIKSSGRLQQRMQEYERYVSQVGAGQVGEITPDENESPRGIALRISRAARRAGKDVRTWVSDGNVYFKLG